MSGYANRIVRREYPELGEKVFVEYRNPRTAAADELTPEDSTNQPHRRVSYQIIARLLRNWCVYDATVDDDESPELQGPATPDMVAAMPFLIVRDIMEDVTAALAPPR